jgi:hypothetical protein
LVKKRIPWNKGKTKETDKRVILNGKNISKSRQKLLSEQGYLNSPKTREKMRLAKLNKPNPHSEEAKINMVKAAAKRILEGKQILGTNGKKFANVITYFYSKKNNKTFKTVSKTIELPCIKYLENNKNVISYEMNRPAISYPYEGRWHNYFPDFVVKIKKGKNWIIECKPKGYLKNKEVQAKARAAKRYCKKHNMKFRFWTENGFIN